MGCGSHLNFLSMEYFVTVARRRNITRAAEELHITQQTLSAHIAAIERELGCPLIVRHTPLELTYAGEIFLRYASDFHQRYQAMQTEFGDITGNQRGLLRIGIAHTRCRAIMPDILLAFQKAYPHIEIRLSEDVNEGLHSRLQNGEIDLAIAHFPDSLPEIVQYPFYDEEVVLLLSKDLSGLSDLPDEHFPLEDLAPFASYPFLLGNPDDIAGRIGRERMKRDRLQPIIRAQSDNIETLLALCAHGMGICFCPENLLPVALSKEQLCHLRIYRLGAGASYPIRFGCRKEPYQSQRIAEFMRIARAALPLPSTQGI